MARGKKRVRTFVKVILAVGIPVFMLALAFGGLCAYLYYYCDEILPTVFIDGVDVSWLTRDEAVQALDLQMYDERGENAEVTVTYPDGSSLKVTGEDVNLTHDAQFWVDNAFSRGRGNGIIWDTADFLQRMYSLYFLDIEAERFEVSYGLDADSLQNRVDLFTEGYNSLLRESGPLIYNDRIVIVKGAGQVSANGHEIYNLILDGLFESLAGGYPVGISYALPEAAINVEELTAIRRRLLALPLPARYDPETKLISDSVVGVDFDYPGAVALLNDTESGKSISIDVEYTQPQVTREYLENLLFRDIIGECVTQIAGTENRLNNIVLASAAISGMILEPGEDFSFNRTVGRRTSALGYKSAPAFSGGQVVQAIGGGICQVSSTIYSAIKDSDIRVTERHAHGRPVTYLPRGRDATVSWGTLDFKFVNNTEYPLRIDVDVDGRTLTVQVFGTLIESEDAETVP